MAEAMHEAEAMREADSPDSVDYAALCDILLPGQRYSEHVAPQLLTALKQAVLMLDKLVAQSIRCQRGVSIRRYRRLDPPLSLLPSCLPRGGVVPARPGLA